MIKIEKLLNECKAYINANEQLSLGQLITAQEFESVQVLSGTLVVSIDEKELVEINASKIIEPVVEPVVEPAPASITPVTTSAKPKPKAK